MVRKASLAILFLCALAAGASAGPAQQWLHVRVEESGPDGDTVRINVPLELVETLLPMVESHEFCKGKVHVDFDEMDHIDLPAVVAAVRKAQDGQYITVEGEDQDVQITKKGDSLLIQVDEDGEEVNIQVRLAVVDALFSGEKNEIDLLAAVQALGKEGNGELVRVVSEDENVRIWIDQQNQSD